MQSQSIQRIGQNKNINNLFGDQSYLDPGICLMDQKRNLNENIKNNTYKKSLLSLSSPHLDYNQRNLYYNNNNNQDLYTQIKPIKNQINSTEKEQNENKFLLNESLQFNFDPKNENEMNKSINNKKIINNMVLNNTQNDKFLLQESELRSSLNTDSKTEEKFAKEKIQTLVLPKRIKNDSINDFSEINEEGLLSESKKIPFIMTNSYFIQHS